jgi:D-threo-aldose 1-dehydrogenase
MGTVMTSEATSLQSIPWTTLGRTGIRTTKLALGTFGWGKVGPAIARVENERALVEVLRTAFEAGIRYVDTADQYQNEDDLGRLMPEANPPADLTIATKFGRGEFTADAFRAHAERSLKALRLEKLPLFFVHDPRGEEHMQQVLGPGGALEGLRKLQSEGLVGHIGIATQTIQPLHIAVDSGEFDVIQFPRLYTLLLRVAKASGLLAKAKAKNMATVLAAPFAGNILATGAVENAVYSYQPAIPEVMDAVRAMEARCAELGTRLPVAACAFAYTEPLLDMTIIGMARPHEVAWNVAPFGANLTREQLDSIADAGAIDSDLLGGPDFIGSRPADRPAVR